MKLTASQKKARTTVGKNLCVRAGAGSGKTQVLVERFIYLTEERGADIDRVLAITFTEKAASEMRARIIDHFRKAGKEEERRKVEMSYISTIHGFSARLLYENAFEAGVDPGFEIMDGARSLATQNAVVEQLLRETYARGEKEFMLLVEDLGLLSFKQIVLSILDKVRTRGRKLSEFQDGEIPQIRSLLGFTRSVEEAYELEKRGRGILDYEDLQLKVHQLLKNPAVSSYYRSYFQHLLVDEFQDTNYLQKSIIDLIRRKKNLFVVGDEGQSIYGFRNAEVQVFTDFQKEMNSSKDGEVIELTDNFRSRPEIIDFLNFFFREISGETSQRFVSLKSSSAFQPKETPSVDLVVVKQGEETLREARVREAELIAHRIKELVSRQNMSYRDIVILFRATTDMSIYEKVLEKSDVPYFTVSGRGFYSKRELRHILSLLRCVDNPRDEIAVASVLRSPLVGVSDDTLYWLARRPLIDCLDRLSSIKEIQSEDRESLLRFRDFFSKLRDMREGRLSQLLEFVMDKTNYDTKLLTQKWGYRRYCNLRKFQDMARGFDREPGFRLKDFLNYMESVSVVEARESEAQVEAESADVVRLMTVHKAKGLEFPAVIVADMGREYSPPKDPVLFSVQSGFAVKGASDGGEEKYKMLHREEMRKEKEEEMRILYVAMTRAVEHLILSGVSKFRELEGRSLNELKRWIDLVREIVHVGTEVKEDSVVEISCGVKVTLVGEKQKPQAKQRKERKSFRDFFRTDQELLAADIHGMARRWNVDPAKLRQDTEEILTSARAEAQPTEEDVINTSVGQLLMLTNCPLRYHMKYNLGMPEKFLRMDDEPGGAEFGKQVHQVFERYDLGRSYEELIARDLDKAQEARIRDMIDGFSRSKEAAELKTAREISRETSFVLKLDGSLISGRIDCLYQTRDGQWTVLDYKTNDISLKELEEEAKEYKIQAWLYGLAILRIKKAESVRVVFYFLSPGKTCELAVTQGEVTKIQAEIASYTDVIRREFFVKRAGNWCRHCPYKTQCKREGDRQLFLRVFFNKDSKFSPGLGGNIGFRSDDGIFQRTGTGTFPFLRNAKQCFFDDFFRQ